mmetsp:Transcript_24692/g.54283  ORF Transcript_24692/g.54283 Transcript_24692/m.54283 type:complete len:331 (-) Transcript_24692:532-1524(-)
MGSGISKGTTILPLAFATAGLALAPPSSTTEPNRDGIWRWEAVLPTTVEALRRLGMNASMSAPEALPRAVAASILRKACSSISILFVASISAHRRITASWSSRPKACSASTAPYKSSAVTQDDCLNSAWTHSCSTPRRRLRTVSPVTVLVFAARRTAPARKTRIARAVAGLLSSPTVARPQNSERAREQQSSWLASLRLNTMTTLRTGTLLKLYWWARCCTATPSVERVTTLSCTSFIRVERALVDTSPDSLPSTFFTRPIINATLLASSPVSTSSSSSSGVTNPMRADCTATKNPNEQRKVALTTATTTQLKIARPESASAIRRTTTAQ